MNLGAIQSQGAEASSLSLPAWCAYWIEVCGARSAPKMPLSGIKTICSESLVIFVFTPDIDIDETHWDVPPVGFEPTTPPTSVTVVVLLSNYRQSAVLLDIRVCYGSILVCYVSGAKLQKQSFAPALSGWGS